MSIDIDHPNEDISTSAGSPPSLGSQAPLVANDATVTANSDGNVSRWVMKTAAGTVGDSGYWAKIASFDGGTAALNRLSAIYDITANLYSTNEQTTLAIIAVQVLDDASGLNSSSKIDVVHTTGPAISSDSFMLVQGTAAQGEIVELWMRKDTAYQAFAITEVVTNDLNNSVVITYNNNAAWQASAPTGAVTITSDWAKPTRVAWTPVVEGQTTVGTATYTTQIGYEWEKDGFKEILIQLAWSGHTGTGNMIITGLNDSNASGAPASLYYGYTDISITTQLTLFIANGSNFVRVYDGSTNKSVQSSGTIYVYGRYAV